MMRLRLGKFCVERRRAEREFAHQQAALRDAVRQVAMPRRVDPVQAGADHRHRGRRDPAAGRLERTLVRGAVDAQRQSRHHGRPRPRPARARSRARSTAPCGVGLRLPTIARLRSSWARSKRAAPMHVEHERRVGRLEQRGGIARGRPASRCGARRRRVRACSHSPGLVDQRRPARAAAAARASACASRHHLPQGGARLRKDCVGQAEGREQPARGTSSPTPGVSVSRSQ